MSPLCSRNARSGGLIWAILGNDTSKLGRIIFNHSLRLC